jgi:exosortase
MVALKHWRVCVLVVVFGALWSMLLSQLSQYWLVDPEYSFGWLVPLLSTYLFWIRWRSRPPGDRPTSSLGGWIFAVTAFTLLPTWVIAQANPDWRSIIWLLTIETVILSLCVIYLVAGRPWLRHFAFSICLIFAAVPWPMVLQETIVRKLTDISTVLTVSALHLFGLHAAQHGNVIELSPGLVGVDEACSGIQSLQAACMISLFLGELYRASAVRRTMLVLSAGLIAFGCNAGRIFTLAATASQLGMGALTKLHDPIGYAFLTACFLLIWGVARAITRPLSTPVPVTVASPTAYPGRLISGLGVWIVFTLVGTEIWYRVHETTDTLHWFFAWPVYQREFSEIPLTESETQSLSFDEGGGAEWINGDGSHWIAYLFRWGRGPSRSRILARVHRPENCFPGAGYKPRGDYGIITIQTQGLSIPFHILAFENDRGKEYVFFCLWEEGFRGSAQPRTEDRFGTFARLRSVLLGQRSLAQQTLEIIISGPKSEQQAETAFRGEIVKLIHTGSTELASDIPTRQGL